VLAFYIYVHIIWCLTYRVHGSTNPACQFSQVTKFCTFTLEQAMKAQRVSRGIAVL